MNKFMKEPRPTPWVKVATIIGLAVILVLIVYFVFSGKSKKRYEGLDELSREILVPQITQATIDPAEAFSVDSLRAVVILKRPMKRAIYKHKWFVDGTQVIGEESYVLANKFFKRGDTVYCRVIASLDQYQSEEVETPEVKIKNSRPVINIHPLEPFNVPGFFQYQIEASDPDGDKLRFLLVSPRNTGITINEGTGLIQWDIPDTLQTENNNQAPDVGIVFEVRDSEGAKTNAAIRLNLIQGREERI